jgi:phage/plasmid primase-like uncharacterized protein
MSVILFGNIFKGTLKLKEGHTELEQVLKMSGGLIKKEAAHTYMHMEKMIIRQRQRLELCSDKSMIAPSYRQGRVHV